MSLDSVSSVGNNMTEGTVRDFCRTKPWLFVLLHSFALPPFTGGVKNQIMKFSRPEMENIVAHPALDAFAMR